MGIKRTPLSFVVSQSKQTVLQSQLGCFKHTLVLFDVTAPSIATFSTFLSSFEAKKVMEFQERVYIGVNHTIIQFHCLTLKDAGGVQKCPVGFRLAASSHRIILWSQKSSNFIPNLNDDRSQISFEVYNVCVAQNLWISEFLIEFFMAWTLATSTTS